MTDKIEVKDLKITAKDFATIRMSDGVRDAAIIQY